MKNITQQKQEIIAAGKRLLAEKLVVRSFGNISLRIDETYMLVTPSGRTYENLEEKDIVLVNYHTSEYEGTIKPSSEKELHCEIYRKRPEIHAVIHTHQQSATTLAAVGRKMPAITDDQAQVLGANVRVAKYALTGSDKLVKNTVKALKNRMAAFMANHGVVCLGRDLEEAFTVSLVLEKSCKLYLNSQLLGGAKPLSKKEAQRMHTDYLQNYSAQDKFNY